jgi:MoaA/NifB/PqqE/SkfB family radical SAM enzyme
MNYLKESLDVVFKIFDKIGIFNIEGGEPLVRKDLHELITYLQKYKNLIGEARFITNGTIIPSEELINACKLFNEKVYFIVDDYGREISPNAELISRMLTENGIRNEYRVQRGDRYMGGWVDFGPFTNRQYTKEQVTKVYNRCKGSLKDAEKQFDISKGIIFPCAHTRILCELNIIDFQDCVNLFDSTDIEQKREKILSMKGKTYFTACKYCNGFSENSPKILAGVQYTREDVEQLLEVVK